MSKSFFIKAAFAFGFYWIISLAQGDLYAQLPTSFVLYSYDTTLIGSSITITGGSVGAKKLVKT
ncbi:MAG TPA: hypothetical protein VKB95_16855, partial [Chitinophagaceae bacterium]|nr:hypothetical protein [Chitinophagaceae bacterium]